MRPLLQVLFLVIPHLAWSGTATLEVSGPHHSGEIVVYRYLDLFTYRTERLVGAQLPGSGTVQLVVPVKGRERMMLRTIKGHVDLYVEEGRHYSLELQDLGSGQARDLAGTARIPFVFHDLDPLDINALISDLNERLDAFVSEDLATDEAAGMQAVGLARQNGKRDTSTANTRPATLFITPALSMSRLDTFEQKLTRFYAEVPDPWFWNYLKFGIGGIRIGPMSNDRELFTTYIAGIPMHYDDPEQVRFFQAFFADHLMLHPFRRHEALFGQAVQTANVHLADSLLAENDFLKTEPRYRELVLLDGLYRSYHEGVLDKQGIRTILRKSTESSDFPEHRALAANMLWDLTHMQKGSAFPALDLSDHQGKEVSLDSLLSGPVCIMVTAGWCTYCAVEEGALEKLANEYAYHVRFIVIQVDSSSTTPGHKSTVGGNVTWLTSRDLFRTLDALRMKAVPAYFLLNDRTLALYPAPPPSQGMAALFHRIKVQAQEAERILINDPPPSPKH